MSEAPTPEQRAASLYAGIPGEAYHVNKRAVPAQAFDWIARRRAECLRFWVHPSSRVFEFGVGNGWNLAALRCKSRVGFDVARQLYGNLRSKGLEIVDSVDEIPSESFDLVIAWHVLEHVTDPMAILGELARILAPEGKMLLVVPFETERRYRRFDAREPNHHLFSWNPQTFGNLLGVAGLHIDSLTWNRYGYDRFAAVGSSRLGLGERGYRVLRASLEILRPLRQIQAVVSSDLKSPRTAKNVPRFSDEPIAGQASG